MKTYVLTDTGQIRKNNQDYAFASSSPVGVLPNLLLVADGMGGHRAGDYASHHGVDSLISYLKNASPGPVVSLLRAGIESVNRELYRESAADKNLRGMGTTLVAAVVDGDTLYVANVGDSRLYLVRGGLRQITKDHSYVEEMVALGQMKRGSQVYQEKKNIITRALGTEQEVEIDFFEENLLPGDSLLLCSDGLTNMVDESEIEKIMLSSISIEEKAKALIESANQGGGRDNIAVVVAQPQEAR